MNAELPNRKFKSLLKEIVKVPVTVMAVILGISVLSCAYGFHAVQMQRVEQNENAVRISLGQLNNILRQVENSFVNYVSSNTNYAYLKSFTSGTPREKTLAHEGDARAWLDQQVKLFDEIRAAFIYYENMDWLQFRGVNDYEVKQYVQKRLREDTDKGILNHWTIEKIDGETWLIYVFHYDRFYGGEWISVEDLQDYFSPEGSSYLGEIYLYDEKMDSTLENEKTEQLVFSGEAPAARITAEGATFYNYVVDISDCDISAGILISGINLILKIPVGTALLFGGVLLSVIAAGFVIVWLQKRIARPVRSLDEAMRLVAQGNVDYRLTISKTKTFNEFDRLAVRFNNMLDELADAEYRLYESELREHRNKLDYISRQIRPHFILNALNIIYTYDETEFPLVKKMVRCLTAYFRYIVNLNVDFVGVRQEMEHIKNYLEIQKERYPNRFTYFVEWETRTEEEQIPPLVIQTFVENCVKYGMLDGQEVFFYVLASLDEDGLHLFIADSGQGFSEEILEKIHCYIETGKSDPVLGVGITNTIERLDILYHGKQKIVVKNAESGGATVEIILPPQEKRGREYIGRDISGMAAVDAKVVAEGGKNV